MECQGNYELHYFNIVMTLPTYSFYVGGKLYWGTDRIFLVERALGLDSHPERIVSPPNQGAAKLTFFFDFSSPWSFLAMERLKDIVASVSPVTVNIEWVPILLGALFKDIGTPMVSAKYVLLNYSGEYTRTAGMMQLGRPIESM